jgi:hypothetical protein
LDLVVALAVEQELVVGRAVRADQLRVLRSRRVLPLGRLVGEQVADGVTLLLALGLLPVSLDRLPKVVVEALVVVLQRYFS